MCTEFILSENMLKQFEAYLKDEEKSRATVEKYIRDLRKMGKES